MIYEKQTFVDGEVLTAGQLNRIEDALARIAASTSNPNLLDNAYFVNPINQRGQTVYGSGYSIDRFAVNGTGATLTLNQGAVTLASADIQAVFIQAFENSAYLVGKTVTLSALVKNNSGGVRLGIARSSTGLYNENGVANMSNVSGDGIVALTATLGDVLTGTQRFNFCLYLSENASCDIVAMKLELGSQQTLARQENGAWILNDPPPNKQQELAKCQRYFQRISNKSGGTSIVGSGQVESNGSIVINIPVPVTMRALTAITAKGIRVRVAGESYLTLAEDYTIGGQRLNTNSIQFSIATTSDVSGLAGKPVAVSLTAETTPSYIDFSADL